MSDRTKGPPTRHDPQGRVVSLSDAAKIAIVVAVAFLLLLAIASIIALSMSAANPSEQTGLFKSETEIREDARPEQETEEDREQAYAEREEMPEVIETNFYETVFNLLASGKFSQLDSQLRDWQETYRDSSDESESKSAVIANYRGDIAFYESLADPNVPPIEAWQFKSPDVLAAAIAYVPIAKKYQAFLNKTSAIFPALSEGNNIMLQESSKTGEELNALRDDINRARTDGTEFQQIRVYTMVLYDIPCEFVAVMDKESATWVPYSLSATDGRTDLPTVSLAEQLIAHDPSINLDVIIAIPTSFPA